MKPMRIATCVFSLLLASSSRALAQDPQAPRSGAAHLQTVTQIEDDSVRQVERQLVQAADAMPEEKYGFIPSGGAFADVRTFALQVKHVAVSNYAMAGAILRENPPVALETADGPKAMTRKADILDFLKGSFVYLHKAVGSINEKTATDQVPNPEGAGTEPKLDLANRQLWHDMNHYGQMVVYLRLNGVIPPASRPRQ